MTILALRKTKHNKMSVPGKYVVILKFLKGDVQILEVLTMQGSRVRADLITEKKVRKIHLKNFFFSFFLKKAKI